MFFSTQTDAGNVGGIGTRGARKQRRVFAIAALEPATLDVDLTTADAVAVEIAMTASERRAGGQCSMRSADETAAVTGDACRIGNDDLSTGAGDFEHAAQMAGMAGIDFIENDACAAAGKPWITGNPAAQLGDGIDAGIVENGTIGLHVELAVDIARDTGRRWSLDLDQWNAVAGRHYGRHAECRGRCDTPRSGRVPD